METIVIERIGNDPSAADVRGMAELLVDAVNGGAGLSFMAGLTHDEAEAWWRSMISSASERSIVLVARDALGVVGTVHLHPVWPPNQRHRADVAKLIVHRRARRRGIARALMQRLEDLARSAAFTLLVLDTVKGSDAERLYQSTGWTRVGEVPAFALNPDGTPCDTVYFYKSLSQ